MKINVPGALWVALITGLIPVVQQVIQQFYPEASYAWSAVVVTVLGVVLKSIQVAMAKPPISDATANIPAAAPAGPPDGDDYTYAVATLQTQSKFMQVLLG